MLTRRYCGSYENRTHSNRSTICDVSHYTNEPLCMRDPDSIGAAFPPKAGDPTSRNTPIFPPNPYNQNNCGSIKCPRCISRGTLIPPSASNTFNSCYCFLRNRSLYLHRLLHGIQTILLSLFVPNCIDLLYATPGNSYSPARSVFYSSIQTVCC